MTPVRVLHEQHTYVTRERSTDDEWDRDDTCSDHSVTGLEIGEDHHGLSIPDAVTGEELHLVYAVYSTGDSFGHDRNLNFEPIMLHRNLDLANANASLLAAADAEEAGYGASVMLTMDDGTTMRYVMPWTGYFESLGYVEVQTLVLGNNGRNRRYPRR